METGAVLDRLVRKLFDGAGWHYHATRHILMMPMSARLVDGPAEDAETRARPESFNSDEEEEVLASF